MRIKPTNWAELQHYKDRAPPWIKLHKKLLDNFEFHSMPLASRALAPMLWLIASEHEDGELDANPDKLAFRLRTSVKEIEGALKPLISNNFFFVVQSADNALAGCLQDACLETEGETEGEGARKRASRKCPSDFQITEDLRTWAKTEVPGVDIDRETKKFKDHTFKTSYTDWDGTWRNWMRRSSESKSSANGNLFGQPTGDKPWSNAR